MYYDRDGVTIYQGDCLEVMAGFPENSIDAVVTDPPYGLEFMGKDWDRLGGAGMSKPGIGERNTEWVSFGGGADFDGANPTCASCGGRARGKKQCSCEFPEWRVKGKPVNRKTNSGPLMQEWHLEWATEALRVAKPGAHLLAFGGTRTHHRLMCAIEDAGWEIRDCLMWVYGSGFPKSLDVSKAIDKSADYEIQSAMRRDAVQSVIDAGIELPGRSVDDWTKESHAPGNKWWSKFVEWVPSLSDESKDRIHRSFIAKGHSGTTAFWNVDGGMGDFTITAPSTDAAKQWDGWGTALKPAYEPIIVARKPLDGTVANNVQKWGVGALNIDGCRVDVADDDRMNKGGSYSGNRTGSNASSVFNAGDGEIEYSAPPGRFPANLIHDGSEEVLECFPDSNGQQGDVKGTEPSKPGLNTFGDYSGHRKSCEPRNDTGSAARFFYCAKASKSDRTPGNNHPTVKPVDLMRYLVRLVCPVGGTVLDPFNGSGATTYAAREESCKSIGIELNEEYCQIAVNRLKQSTLF